MKAVVCTSLHLGNKDTGVPALLEAAVRENGASALLIPGDLFDDHQFGDDIYFALYNAFSAMPDTHVFICPGASDPLLPDSPYIMRDWPDNVHIFKEKLKAFEVAGNAGSDGAEAASMRVYGRAAVRHRPVPVSLSAEKIPRPDKNFVNVFMLSSGPLAESAVNSDGGSDDNVLKSSGFDAFVFGDRTEICSDREELTLIPFVYPNKKAKRIAVKRDFAVNSAYIYGFGPIGDKNVTFEKGLNFISCDAPGEAEEKARLIRQFILAVLCGFAEDIGGDPALLPSREQVKPEEDRPFGGELRFTESGSEYIVAVKWGDNPDEDVFTLVKSGESSVAMPEGKNLCEMLWQLSPENVARLIGMPGDGRDVSLAVTALRGKTTNSPVQSAETDAETAEKQALTPEGARIAAEYLEETRKELEAVDAIEEKLAALGEKVREAEKTRNESARKNKDELSVERIRKLSERSRTFDRAASMREEASELLDEIDDEARYVRKMQRPWLILLWILTVLSAIAIVLLVIFPEKVPGLGTVLETIKPLRYPMLIGFGALFLVSIIGIAGVSGSGMKRLTLLREELDFRKRQLSEICSPVAVKKGTVKLEEGESAERFSLYFSFPDNDSFFAETDKVLNVLSKKAADAAATLEGAAAPSAESSVNKPAGQYSAESYAALTAERSVYEEQLSGHRSYPALEEKCAELEALVSGRSDSQSRTELTEITEDIGLGAGQILNRLSGGAYENAGLSPELVPFVVDGGNVRTLGNYSGSAYEQIKLSFKLAELSAVARSDDAPGIAGFSIIPGPASNTDGEDAAMTYIKELADSRTSPLQLIIAASPEKTAGGHIITI